MPYILMIVGAGLIAFYFLNNSNQKEDAPTPVSSKYLYGGAGIGSFLLAAYLLYTVPDAWAGSAWKGLIYVVFSIALIIFGGNLCKAAYDADEKEAKDALARTQAAAAKTEHQLLPERRETESAKLSTERTGYKVRDNLADVAIKKGLDIDSVINVHSTEYLSNIHLKEYGVEKKIDLDFYEKEKEVDHQYSEKADDLALKTERGTAEAQLDAADRVEHYRLIEGLENQLEDLLRKRRKIALDEEDEVLRGEMTDRLNIRIEAIERDIDAKQNRLLSASDGKETK